MLDVIAFFGKFCRRNTYEELSIRLWLDHCRIYKLRRLLLVEKRYDRKVRFPSF